MDKQLRTLVDLEALLNDGTAYVLFFLLRVWAEGRHQSAGDAIRRVAAVLRHAHSCSARCTVYGACMQCNWYTYIVHPCPDVMHLNSSKKMQV